MTIEAKRQRLMDEWANAASPEAQDKAWRALAALNDTAKRVQVADLKRGRS